MEKEYKNLKNKKLALFFTYGVSLELWKKKGMLERELKLYKKLGKHFNKIYFVTYGKSDYEFQSELSEYNIEILHKKNNLPNFVYSLLLPLFYKKELSQVDFYKTNQMLGSWSAVIAKWIYKKKMIARTGYTLSIFSRRTSKIKYFFSKLIEFFALHNCYLFIVATEEEKENFKKYKNKIKIIPNYVDTDLFKPLSDLKNKEQAKILLFVGRLNKQKNLKNFILSLESFENIKLQIIGSGELKEELKKLAIEKKVEVEFLGNKAHEELPKYINYADIFVLPSLYEGNPKVLLEAMACAVPILTTRVKGIENIVENGVDSVVVGTSVEDLKQGLKEMTSIGGVQREKLEKKAREIILKNNSLEKVLQLELKNYV